MFNVALTNLGKYNEGELIYTWLSLPATDEEITAAMDKIGINEEYEEFFITDYENDYDYAVGEYDNLEDLNEKAETLEAIDDYQMEIIKALISEGGYDLGEAIDKADDCIYFPDCNDMSDVAYQLVEEGIFLEVPENIKCYLDYDAIGRDLNIEGTFYRTENGYIEVL